MEQPQAEILFSGNITLLISLITINEVAFGYWVDNAIGDDGSDELAYFDTDLDMSYSWDINGIGKGLPLVQWALHI